MSFEMRHTVTGKEPVQLVDMKLYLRTDYTTDDSIIIALITAAREQAEKFCNRSFVSQIIEYSRIVTIWDASNYTVITLPYPSHLAITEVKVNGTVITDYTKKGLTQFTLTIPALELLDSSAMCEIYIKYTTTDNCPELVKIALKNMVKDMAENRNDKQMLPNPYTYLAPFKLYV